MNHAKCGRAKLALVQGALHVVAVRDDDGRLLGRNRVAASAGDSVSELIAEMIVEIAMVTANWR